MKCKNDLCHLQMNNLNITVCFDEELNRIFRPEVITAQQLTVALAETIESKQPQHVIARCTYRDGAIRIVSIRDTDTDVEAYKHLTEKPFYFLPQ